MVGARLSAIAQAVSHRFRGARTTNEITLGVLAGLIAGCVALLITNVVIDVVSVASFDYLRQHALADRDFVRSGMSDYGAFLFNDALGGLFYGTTLSTILGAMLGILDAKPDYASVWHYGL